MIKAHANYSISFYKYLVGVEKVAALLFAMFSAAMLFGYLRMPKFAYAAFALAIAVSLYWFKFHATAQLTIQL
ncbi:MAG TPA: hypothetical protein DCE52_12230 [Rhodobacteraceae bacterium]|nr:hypothetical protein [Paracoccaceae bacterium]